VTREVARDLGIQYSPRVAVTEPAPKTPLPLRLAAALGALLVVAFIGAALFGEEGVTRHERLRAELRELEAMNGDLARTNARLEREVEALKSDERYIEAAIRDELGWVSPDDMVLIFPE